MWPRDWSYKFAVLLKKTGTKYVVLSGICDSLEREYVDFSFSCVSQLSSSSSQKVHAGGQSEHRLCACLWERCSLAASPHLQPTGWTRGTAIHFMHLCVLCKWFGKGKSKKPEWWWQIICIGSFNVLKLGGACWRLPDHTAPLLFWFLVAPLAGQNHFITFYTSPLVLYCLHQRMCVRVCVCVWLNTHTNISVAELKRRQIDN